MKKIVSFLILNIGIFVLCSGQVLANDEIMITHNEFAVVTSTEMNGIIPVQEFGFTYLGGDKLALTECFPELMEDATEIIIPKSVGDYDVTQINSNAFSRCTQVKSIVVPDSVETVECGAFYGCTSLEKITLPFVGKTRTDAQDKTSVFGHIFDYETIITSKETMQYSNNGTYYFYFIPSTLREVVITDTTQIPKSAFVNCSFLTNIVVPDTIEKIGENAFGNCSGITEMNIPESVTSIGRNAFASCTGLTEINIPDNITAINEYTFYNCSFVKEFDIPDTVTWIGSRAFQGCSSLSEICLPNALEEIGERAFQGCAGFTEICIPDSVTFIGDRVFEDCMNLEKITIPFLGESRSKASILGHLFGRSDQSSADTVYQSDGTFKYYYIPRTLREIVVTDVEVIADNALKNCSFLTKIVLPETVKGIGGYAFYNCSGITDINIPDNITAINAYTFYKCSSLTEIDIPEGVTAIGERAFYNCAGIASIDIPESLTSIDKYAFDDCINLKAVYYRGTEGMWNDIAISSGNDYLKNNVVFVKYTKTDISDDGKTFTVTPVNIDAGNTVIIALYNGGKITDIQTAIYNDEELTFNTDKEYTEVKIMAWNDLKTFTPLCIPEIIS